MNKIQRFEIQVAIKTSLAESKIDPNPRYSAWVQRENVRLELRRKLRKILSKSPIS